MHLIFSFWTASSQADPWSQSLHFPLLNFCFQPSTSASWIQGQITKLHGEFLLKGKAFLSVTQWGSLRRLFLSSRYWSCAWMCPAVLLGLWAELRQWFVDWVLNRSVFPSPVSPAVSGRNAGASGLVAALQPCSLCSLLSACQARADKELILWTLVSRYKLRIETYFYSNIFGSGHIISEGQVLDLF